jgi:NAD(P)-dependent dehydrogenase (short-subunit alcohol dehydrogenase family)
MYTVPDQTGRTFVVTGANSGTGKEAVTRLAAAGATVLMAVRSLDKGATARLEILDTVPGANLIVRQLDLADLANVRLFAQALLEEGHQIDVLVNNAGVMAPPKRMLTVDGFELQWGTNFLGPFALTNLLLPRIFESDAPRVTTMSSFVANFGRINFADLDATKGYRPFVSYGQSKLADMLMGRELARIASARNWPLLSTVAHPGFTRTNLQSAGANLGRTRAPKQPGDRTFLPSQGVEVGTEPLLFAAADRDVAQGAYYGPRGSFGLRGPTRKIDYPRTARSVELAQELWGVAEKFTDTSLPIYCAPLA